MTSPRDDIRAEAHRFRAMHLLNVALAGSSGKAGDCGQACDMAQEAFEAALLTLYASGLEDAAKVASATSAEYARIANNSQNDVLWPTFLARAEVSSEIARDIRAKQKEPGS